MNPEEIVGTLGWLGWVVGLVSGAIQVQMWRRERKVSPAREKLFEEALRDRKGEYTEAQIAELSALHRKLETATKKDIPRQARRIYLENQIEALDDSLIRDIKYRVALKRELGDIADAADGIPAELSEAIRSSIAPLAVQRRRWQLRLATLAIICLLILTFPEVVVVARDQAVYSLGEWPQPYGALNFIVYVVSVLFVALVLFALSGERIAHYARRNWIAKFIGWTCLIIGLASAVVLTITFNKGGWDTYQLSVISALTMGVAIRVLLPVAWGKVRRQEPKGGID